MKVLKTKSQDSFCFSGAGRAVSMLTFYFRTKQCGNYAVKGKNCMYKKEMIGENVEKWMLV